MYIIGAILYVFIVHYLILPVQISHPARIIQIKNIIPHIIAGIHKYIPSLNFLTLSSEGLPEYSTACDEPKANIPREHKIKIENKNTTIDLDVDIYCTKE
jgi:hypothetical protein